MTLVVCLQSGTRLLHADGDDSSSAEYERDHLAAVQAEKFDTIAKSDPDDMPAFETARRAGLGLIAKMNLDYRKCSFRTSA